MLASMTAQQFYEWLEFARLEPFGEDREDARAASIVQVIANVNRNPKKRGPIPLADCALPGGDMFDSVVRQKQDWRSQKMLMMAALIGGKPKQPKKDEPPLLIKGD